MCLTMSRGRKCGVFQTGYQFRSVKRNVDYMNTMSAHIFSYIHETCSSFLGTRKSLSYFVLNTEWSIVKKFKSA